MLSNNFISLSDAAVDKVELDPHWVALSVGHVFTVEEYDDNSFTSVFPRALSDLQQSHSSELDAWQYIIDNVEPEYVVKYGWRIDGMPIEIAKKIFGDVPAWNISAKHSVFDDIQYSSTTFIGSLSMALSHIIQVFGGINGIQSDGDSITVSANSYTVELTKN